MPCSLLLLLSSSFDAGVNVGVVLDVVEGIRLVVVVVGFSEEGDRGRGAAGVLVMGVGRGESEYGGALRAASGGGGVIS